MLTAYMCRDGVLHADRSGLPVPLAEATWIDLLAPSRDEESAVEALLGIEVPTPEEMREIETSSRLYRDRDAAVITLRVTNKSNVPAPLLVDVTFILTPSRLITLRYADPTPFRIFVSRAEREGALMASADSAAIGLMEAIIDRAADLLEGIGDELGGLSSEIFAQDASVTAGPAKTDLGAVMKRIGRSGDLASMVRESVHGLGRSLPFLRLEAKGRLAPDVSVRLDTLRRDTKSLLDHDAYLVGKIHFLLDSTLGLINIQQNAIIKIFSVAAVIFLPPTLIASIYGMNFQHMPELAWLLGYPWALGLMGVSAVLPYWFFKRRGWL